MGCEQFLSEGNRENALSFYPGQGLHWRSGATWRSVLGSKPFGGWSQIEHEVNADEFLLLTPKGAMKTRCVRRLEGDNAWDLQFLNLCVGSPWSSTARSTQQTPTIQRKDELESGRRAKIVYLRQNIVEKYGRTAGCLGIGQHTEECRARIEQEMVNKGDALSSRHLEISKKLCQNLISV